MKAGPGAMNLHIRKIALQAEELRDDIDRDTARGTARTRHAPGQKDIDTDSAMPSVRRRPSGWTVQRAVGPRAITWNHNIMQTQE